MKTKNHLNKLSKLSKLRKIKIGGLIYKIEYISGLADFGSTHFDKQIILINKDLTDEKKVSVLYHEMIEIWNEMGDFNLNHQTIQTMESYMFQTFKENEI